MSEKRWEACRQTVADERAKWVSALAAERSKVERIAAELAAERGKRQDERRLAESLAVERAAEREKVESELASERGKTSALQSQVHDLMARVRHLADISQQQQMDIEWMTGLRRDDVSAPSILRRRQQRG